MSAKDERRDEQGWFRLMSRAPDVEISDFHAFERDLLYAVRALERDGELPTGLAIKAELEAEYREEINHSRLYQNLGALVNPGRVEKGKKIPN